MSVTYDSETLPMNKDSWLAATRRYKTASIHDLESLESASKITVEQFLSLRVLWPKLRKVEELYRNTPASLFNSSEEELQKSRSEMKSKGGPWNAYLEAIEGRGLHETSSFPKELGEYALVLQNQLEASKLQNSLSDSNRIRLTPYPKRDLKGKKPDYTGKGSSPQSQGSYHPSDGSYVPEAVPPMTREEAFGLPIGDEQVVNTAAINFLNALFIHDKRPATWTLQRKQFKFSSLSVEFEARTDGHFQVHGKERSAAILEVKPRVRLFERGCRIEMQESAQMVLWIFQEPNSHWAPSKEGASFL